MVGLILSCSICLNSIEDVAADDIKWLVVSSCGHIFHKHCLNNWLTKFGPPNCPRCRGPASNRKEIFPDFEEQDTAGGSPTQKAHGEGRPRTQGGDDAVTRLRIMADEAELRRENARLRNDLEWARSQLQDTERERVETQQQNVMLMQQVRVYDTALHQQRHSLLAETEKLTAVKMELEKLKKQRTELEHQLQMARSKELIHKLHTSVELSEAEILAMKIPEKEKTAHLAKRVESLGVSLMTARKDNSMLTAKINTMAAEHADEADKDRIEIKRLRRQVQELELQLAAEERRDASLHPSTSAGLHGPGSSTYLPRQQPPESSPPPAPAVSSFFVPAHPPPLPAFKSTRPVVGPSTALLARAPRAAPSLADTAAAAREVYTAANQTVQLTRGKHLSMAEPDIGVRAKGYGGLKIRDVNIPHRESTAPMAAAKRLFESQAVAAAAPPPRLNQGASSGALKRQREDPEPLQKSVKKGGGAGAGAGAGGQRSLLSFAAKQRPKGGAEDDDDIVVVSDQEDYDAPVQQKVQQRGWGAHGAGDVKQGARPAPGIQQFLNRADEQADAMLDEILENL